MKKITLIAAAAMAATTAIAGTPAIAHRAPDFKASGLTRSAVLMRADRNAIDRHAAFIDRTDDGDLTDVTPEVGYVLSANAFYSGMTPTTAGYSKLYAFTGIRNAIGFRNITQGATEFDWQYGRVNGLIEDRTEYTYDYINSSETNLFMELAPFARYSFPTLAATFGDEIYNTAATVNQLYHCGRDAYYWGFSAAADDAEEITWNDILGVTPTAYDWTGWTTTEELAVIRPGAKRYDAKTSNANGASDNWEVYSEDDFVLTNIRMKGLATYIPQMPSPYQMNAMWLWFLSEVKEDVAGAPLTVNVYAIGEDGEVDFNALIGTGELTLPEGSYTIQTTGEMPVVEINAVDEDGYAIDSPCCVEAGQSVFVMIEGLENEDILDFEPTMNWGAQAPASMDRTIRNYMFPTHAYGVITADVAETNDGVVDNYTTDFVLPAPYAYYTDATYSTLWLPRDFNVYFDINFPIVINYDEASADYETADFNYEVKQEGETITVPVGCSYKIDVLMEEGLADCTTSSWLGASAVYDEETGVTNVTITAEANDGADRTGYVIYRGYAIDFWITVNQKGSQDGIQVVDFVPVANGAEYFDLQGRRLPAQPTTGIYLQRVNGTTTKYIAK